MKHFYLFFIGLLFASFATLNAQTTVTWAQTSDVSASPSSGDGFTTDTVSLHNVSIAAYAKYPYDGGDISDSIYGAKVRGADASALPLSYDATYYEEYTLTAATGYDLTVSAINMGMCGKGTGSIYVNVAYSTDDFATSSSLVTEENLENQLFKTYGASSLSVSVASGSSLKVRIYPWYNSSSSSTTKYLMSRNVQITFTTTATSGIDEATDAATVVKTEYFSITGAKLAQPTNGITIVKETLSNGKVVCSKTVK